MDRHTPIRTRIPAALAAASAATVERAKHLLHDAGRIIHLPDLFGTRNVGTRPPAPKPGPVRPNERSGGDDTQ
jgi:hypothetical protein